MGCPHCEPGDVEVTGPGAATCSLCKGGFQPMPKVLAALKLERKAMDLYLPQGQKCPICTNTFRPFKINGERFHACVTCDAIWVDPGSLERALAAPPVNAPVASASATPSTTSGSRPAIGAAPVASPNAMPPLSSGSRPAVNAPVASANAMPPLSSGSRPAVNAPVASANAMPPLSSGSRPAVNAPVASANAMPPLSSGSRPAVSAPVASTNAMPPLSSGSRPAAKPETSNPSARPESSKPIARPETSKPVARPESSNPSARPESSKPVARPKPEDSGSRARPETSKPVARPSRSPAARKPENVELRWPSRLFAVVVVLAIAALVAFEVRPPPSTAIGGGRSVRFWRDVPVKPDHQQFSWGTVDELRSERDNGWRLEAAFASSGVESKGLAAIVQALYGSRVKLSGDAPAQGDGTMTFAKQPSRAARIYAWVDGDRAWILSASAPDDGTFAVSDAAWTFLQSFGH